MAETIIELKNIQKCYIKDTAVVDGFSLTIKKGEFVTFLGPSGCGKTTILRMIGGFEVPTSGEILLHGKDISSLPANKRPINTVFQKYALFPHLNIYDNIAFGLKLKKLPRREIDQKVRHALEVVDLEGFERRHISTLSGGQQQRIAIARAIVNNPKVLIADEPTGNLDPENSWEIMNLLERINLQGTTILMATHNSQIVNTLRHRVIAIEDGRVVRDEVEGEYGYDD